MTSDHEEQPSIRVSSVVIQIVVTVILAGAASFVGILQGSAVVKAQMGEMDRRVTKLEQQMDELSKQQIEVYRSQLLILQKQLEQSSESRR
jgi:hypothetical protein